MGGNKVQPATSLFVAQPVDAVSAEVEVGERSQSPFVFMQGSQGTPVVLPAAQMASLYSKKGIKSVKPRSEDLSQSGLFQQFGSAAVIQGVDDGTPRLVLDKAQVATLSNTMRALEPHKVKAVPDFRLKKFPLHEQTELFLTPPEVDPVFLDVSAAKAYKFSAGEKLVLSKSGLTLDRNLVKVQKALVTGIAAQGAVQQGLGKVMKLMTDEPFDPAVVKATLSEVFEASQDAMDQMGRSCALQQYSRRVNLVASSGLSDTPVEKDMLQMPLSGSFQGHNWVFGAQVGDVIDRVRATKSAVSYLASSSRTAGPKGRDGKFGFKKQGGFQQPKQKFGQFGQQKNFPFSGQNPSRGGRNFRDKYPRLPFKPHSQGAPSKP
jgi:hypothetical protein